MAALDRSMAHPCSWAPAAAAARSGGALGIPPAVALDLLGIRFSHASST
jgi:hypothetical protein